MKNLSILIMSLITGLSATAQNLKDVNYSDGHQVLKGLVTSNAGQALPGVVVLPAWKGIDKEAKDAALALEKEGYMAFVADIYGEDNVPEDQAAAAKISGHYKQDYQAYQYRILLALNELKKAGAVPDKIAIIGYCFGGTGALEAARGSLPVAGVVSIHGGLAKATNRANQPVTTKVLVEHPADDASVKPEDLENLIKELKEGKTDWQIITYANCKHTFTNPESVDYNMLMAKRAWQHTLIFLKEILN